MTTFLLVRHGRHDTVDKLLLGRSDPVGLSDDGRQQIARLAFFLARHKVDLIQTSPRRRCRETATELAVALQAPVEDAEALDELDFGEWTGRSFEELQADARWKKWNEQRDSERPPGGEGMRAAQARVLRHMQCLSAVYPASRIVLVSHAEIIRAVLLRHNRMSLRDWEQLRIEPGTVWCIDEELGEIREEEAIAS